MIHDKEGFGESCVPETRNSTGEKSPGGSGRRKSHTFALGCAAGREEAWGGWGREGPVSLGADRAAAAMAEVVVQLAVGKDQEEPLLLPLCDCKT